MPITNQSAPAEKITLFRSLFRGREEVYPARFESVKSGKSGYSPVCGNEWVRGICEKPRIKCGRAVVHFVYFACCANVRAALESIYACNPPLKACQPAFWK
jgi:hypothetical protein